MDMKKYLSILLIFSAMSSVCFSEMITDSFDDPHDYLTAGVAGTIWDGFVGQGSGETVSRLNASRTAPGALYVSSVNARWEPIWSPLGPFLYVDVNGDFTATVKVIGASSMNWNTAGLAVRIPNPIGDGSNENFETMEYFRAIDRLMARTVINGVENEFATATPLTPYLRLRKEGNLIYHEYSSNGTDWTPMAGSPKTRNDMVDSTLQVGIQHATYSNTEGYFEFDDFVLEIDDPVHVARPGSPADGQKDVPVDAGLTWLPGESASPTGGHDLYIGLNYNDVFTATRTSHPNVAYYNLDPNSFDPGGLQAGTTYYWRVDEVNLPAIWTGAVWRFTVQDGRAAVPAPADNAAGTYILPVLSWQNGLGADRHDIFFSDSYEKVLNAEKDVGDINSDGNVDPEDLNFMTVQWQGGACGSQKHCADIYPDRDVNLMDFYLLTRSWLLFGSDVFKGSMTGPENSYVPGLLNPATTYFWRVDEFDYDAGIRTPGDIWSFTTLAGGPLEISHYDFDLTFDITEGGFTKIQHRSDVFETNFLSTPGWLLGDIETTYRIDAGSWQFAATHASDDNRQVAFSMDGDNIVIDIVYPTASTLAEGIGDFGLSQQWVLSDEQLTLNVQIVNTTGASLELGDLAVPLPFNSDYSGLDTDTIQTRRVLRHGFFSGHASHAYWSRVNGKAPFLVMTTPGADTRFEYWDNINSSDVHFKAYVHSGVTGPATPGNWRQAHTTNIMAPGESVHLMFNFSWADSLACVRDALYQDGMDIECVPGMTIPQDLYALVKLRTRHTIDSLIAEYPGSTTIEYAGQPEPDTHIYKISFGQLGENMITVNHNGGEQTILEFFSTEPLETLYKKRASHMVNYEQVVNSSVWYDGLFGEWDLRNGVLRTPDNTDGMNLPWWIYVICCDDPGNAHAPFLAGKNVRFPVQAEIDALEYHIENYIWGGLQYTDTEYSPYGVLGVPTWNYNRANDPDHFWRVFDYPHIVMLYYHMYEIAKYYPDMVSYLDADGYLNRAYHTALKYFNVADGWGYVVGTYNEVVYPELISALRRRGWTAQADALEAEWDKKAKYFILDKEYPYISEYAMDSTAFESTHALVRWAMKHGLEPDDDHPMIDPDRIEAFMHGQMQANLAVRGCIEPAFYTYGSDYRVWGQTRYTLSYMSQMGGWAVLDYGLNWTDAPIEYIRLGYGSYLSSWALMNSDATGSNGYWFPSAANDGAIGWAFKPEKNGPIWLQGRTLDRGIWYYNGEIDLGLCGALRAARSVVVDDPVFGLFGFGCDVELNGNTYAVVPKDGLREWLVMHNLDLELSLDRDSFAAGESVVISRERDAIGFTLENERPTAHTTTLKVSGLAVGEYAVQSGGVSQGTITISDPDATVPIALSVDTLSTYTISINKL